MLVTLIIFPYFCIKLTYDITVEVNAPNGLRTRVNAFHCFFYSLGPGIKSSGFSFSIV